MQLTFIETTFEITFTCVIFTIAIFRCIGHIATLGKIVYDSKYHTPPFAVIGQLALADFLSVTILTFANLTNFLRISTHLNVIIDTLCFSSFSQVCLLSAVRYLITVHPLQRKKHLTVTAVCLCSLSMWITSGVANIGLIYTAKAVSTIYVTMIDIILRVFILLIVCSTMTIFHVKKIRTLQKSLSVTDQSQRRMNIVVTVIIRIFVLFQLSFIAMNIMIIIDYQQFSTQLFYHTFNIKNVYVFIGCIIFSCNPYVLFLSQFLQSFAFNFLTLYTSL